MQKFRVLTLPHLLVLYTLLPQLHSSIYDFPAFVQWQNSLNSVEKVQQYLGSNALFAREVVTSRQDDNGHTLAYLGFGELRLVHALNILRKSRKDHQVMLIFTAPLIFATACPELTINSDDWLWYYFPIEQGPNNKDTPVSISDFDETHTKNMAGHPLAFGFTSDRNFGRGEYLRETMELLIKKTDDWYTKLNYHGQFMVELSLLIVANTSGPTRVLKELIHREMYVNFATLAKHKDVDLIVRQRGMIQALSNQLGRNRVFLNIPEDLRTMLNPGSWWANASIAICHGARKILWYPLPILVLIHQNKINRRLN